MSITVNTPAEVTGLTTVAACKRVLGITTSDQDDELVRLIQVATDAIHEYVGHNFSRQNYTEAVEGTEFPVLMVTHVPIVGTPTIVVDSAGITDFEVRDADVGLLWRDTGWARSEWIGWATEPSIIPGTGKRDVFVTYDAGYYLPGQPDRNLPFNIEQACLETVLNWRRQQSRDDQVQSKKVGDLTITYKEQNLLDTAAFGLPPSARAMLERRVK